jgi:hypothetical protein
MIAQATLGSLKEVFLYHHSMGIMASCSAGAVDSFVVMKLIDLI